MFTEPLSNVCKGYSAPGKEKVTQHVYDAEEIAHHRAKAPDVKESFESGREDDSVMPNIWLPDGVLPGFKEACLDYFWVSSRIMTASCSSRKSLVLPDGRHAVPWKLTS